MPTRWTKGPSLSSVGLVTHERTEEVWGELRARSTAMKSSKKGPFLNWPMTLLAHLSLQHQVNTALHLELSNHNCHSDPDNQKEGFVLFYRRGNWGSGGASDYPRAAQPGSDSFSGHLDQCLLCHCTERTGRMEQSSVRGQMFPERYRETLSLDRLAPTLGLRWLPPTSSPKSTVLKHCCHPMLLLQQWNWHGVSIHSQKHQFLIYSKVHLVYHMGTSWVLSSWWSCPGDIPFFPWQSLLTFFVFQTKRQGRLRMHLFIRWMGWMVSGILGSNPGDLLCDLGTFLPLSSF